MTRRPPMGAAVDRSSTPKARSSASTPPTSMASREARSASRWKRFVRSLKLHRKAFPPAQSECVETNPTPKKQPLRTRRRHEGGTFYVGRPGAQGNPLVTWHSEAANPSRLAYMLFVQSAQTSRHHTVPAQVAN